jgi:hypothetical protein
MRYRNLLFISIPILCLGLSCADDTPSNSEPGPDFIAGSATSFFIPLLPGASIILAGTESIVDQGDSLISQDPFEMHFSITDRTLRSDCGFITRMMRVSYISFRQNDSATGEVYVRGTADTVFFYSRSLEESTTRIFLKTPFLTGSAWPFGSSRAEILSVKELVSTPAGLFSHVMHVRFMDEFESDYRLDVYFAKGIGMIRWTETSNQLGDRYIIDVKLKSKSF